MQCGACQTLCSAAKTVQEMGMERVAHMGGGFAAWKEAGGPVLKTEDGREPR